MNTDGYAGGSVALLSSPKGLAGPPRAGPSSPLQPAVGCGPRGECAEL